MARTNIRAITKTKVTLSIDSETYARFRQYSDKTGISISKWVTIQMNKEMQLHRLEHAIK